MAFSELYISGVRLTGPPPEPYLRQVAAIRWLERLEGLTLSRPVTFLVGENGMGKSTLLEAIAVAWGFNPEGGTVNFNFSTRDSHSRLWERLRLIRGVRRPRDGFFLRAESFYNVATQVDELSYEQYYGGSLHERSHGESFLALVQNRFSGRGLYLLDEPEAALSPRGQLALLCCIHDLVGLDSQFIIATHSPLLMAFPGAELLQLDEEGISRVELRETSHYQLTRRFLEAPEKMLAQLLAANEQDDD
ncbi:MAG: AAA family ATPase [Firmicutes bacterium]|nr:AAA family ATPase [Bacillota bacterium]